MNGQLEVKEPMEAQPPLDVEDQARLFTTFMGLTRENATTLHLIDASRDGTAPAWIFDEESGMVYILD